MIGLRSALGLDARDLRVLDALARRRGGRARYWSRSIACAVALSGPGERWIPYRQRRRAINALLDLVFRDPPELMLYAGLVDRLGDAPCGGLLPE
jgi:hypothetical protein